MTSEETGRLCDLIAHDRDMEPAAVALRPLPRVHLSLGLALTAAALAALVLVSAVLWQLQARATHEPAAGVDSVLARTQVDVLRLHEATENLVEDPGTRAEFATRLARLQGRLAQLRWGPQGQSMERLGLDDDIAVAHAQLLRQDATAQPHDGAGLAVLLGQLVRLDTALAAEAARAGLARHADEHDLAARRRGVMGLGLMAALAGAAGLASLALRMTRAERCAQDHDRLQQELQRARDGASYLRNIAAVIAHQMRGPLAVIDSAAQRMAAAPARAEPADAGAAAQRIRHQVRRMLHFMDQATLAGAVEDAAPAIDLRPVAVADLVAMVAAHDAIHDRRGRLVVTFGAAGQARILCDRELAFHALVNLVENALKYSPDDSPVHLHVTERDGMGVVSVIDHGQGVPVAEREAIFLRFRRGSNAAGRPGNGIGLWLARRLAEAQGGAIRVDSDGRTGARFDLCLPLAATGTAPPEGIAARIESGAQHGVA